MANAIANGTKIYLLEQIKDYAPGTEMTVKKSMPTGGDFIYMCAIDGGDGRTVPVKAHQLSTALPSGEDGNENDGDLTGAVMDFFLENAPMDTDVAVNAATNYISTFGVDDLDVLMSVVDGLNLEAGGTWSVEDTAKVSRAISEVTGGEADPEATKILKKAEAAAKVAEKRPPGRPKKEDAPKEDEKPAPKAKTAVVDRATWTATKMGALRLVGALAGFYGEDPDSFDAELALAVKMIKRAADTSEK